MSEGNNNPPIMICLLLGLAISLVSSGGEEESSSTAPVSAPAGIERRDGSIQLRDEAHEFPHHSQYTAESNRATTPRVSMPETVVAIATGAPTQNNPTGLGHDHGYLSSYWSQVSPNSTVPEVRVEQDIILDHAKYGRISPPGYFDSESNTVVLETQVAGTDAVSTFVRAHEVGHSIQMQEAGGTQVFDDTNMIAEQQADCYAGAAIAHGVATGQLTGTSEEYAAAAASFGNSRSSAHGRSHHRRDVFLHGYSNGYQGCQG